MEGEEDGPKTELARETHSEEPAEDWDELDTEKQGEEDSGTPARSDRICSSHLLIFSLDSSRKS